MPRQRINNNNNNSLRCAGFLGHFDPALGRFVFRLIDARCGIESQLAAFSKCGYEVPPRTAELKDLMLQAARRDHEEQCGLDRARPWAERYDHSTWIDSVLEAQRRGQGPPRRVDDADGDGGDDDGDFMPDQPRRVQPKPAGLHPETVS